jgi:hypothetical protein
VRLIANFFFVLLFFEAAARATPCNNPLVSTCINDDTFWPHAGPAQLLTVGATETTAKGQVGFGFVTSYLSRPIVLHMPAPGPSGTDEYAINDQVNGNFLWSYGVTNQLELDVVLPITFGQGGAGASPITGGKGISDTATRDLRFGFAYAIVPRARVDAQTASERGGAGGLWALTARAEVSAPTGDADQFAGEGRAVLIPSVAADLRSGQFFGGVELGARIRPTAEIVGARVGSQLLGAIGAGYDVVAKDVLALAIEARALYNFPAQHDSVEGPTGLLSTPNGLHVVPAEWGPSFRSAFGGGDFSLMAGAAFPFTPDPPILTPRWRFTLGLRYAPLERDSDGDGVLDRNDFCPHERALPVPGAPNDGCPHEASPPAPAEETPPDPRGSTRTPAAEPDTVDATTPAAPTRPQ